MQVIYVYRNPKDILVSYFHFRKLFPGVENSINLAEFMQKFLSGDGKMKIKSLITTTLSKRASVLVCPLGVTKSNNTQFEAFQQ